MSVYETEPIRGLPGDLPAGETLLWQGSPVWRQVAIRVFHARKVAIYFGLLMLWRVAATLADGGSAGEAAFGALVLILPALAALGFIAAFAMLVARTTVYSITSRRVVMRYGMALPMALNLPFKKIVAGGLKLYPDGSGDLPIALAPPDRIAYFVLWPHARPWRVQRPEPMLRCIPDAARVADLLASAVAAAAPAAAVVPAAAATVAPSDTPPASLAAAAF